MAQTPILELAYALGCLGQIERAEAWIREFWPTFAAPIYQPVLNKLLGFLALLKGEGQAAAGYYLASLRQAYPNGHRLLALLSLEGYAWTLAKLLAEPKQAARLLGSAAEFRERVGAKVFPRDLPVQEGVIAALTASLGEVGSGF
jgi:hypothetical protein